MGNVAIKPGGALKTDYITITSPMLIAQQATLSGVPAIPINTLVEAGGVAQKYATDFVISGNIIVWASMGLDSILSVGDVLLVQYFTL